MVSRKKTAKDVMLPHSQAKVAFYREYLTRFLSIMSVSSYCQVVNIFDIFCGRGIYSDGGHGSPIQAMETIQRVRKDHPSNTIFHLYLNDLVTKNVEGVKEYIEQNFSNELCTVKYLNKPANTLFLQLPTLLNSTPKESKNLLFIDPYGYKEIHKENLYNLLKNKRTEILLFLPISFMHRFSRYAFDGNANKSAEPLKNFISEFFPSRHPVRSDQQPMDVKTYIKELADAFSFDNSFLTTSYFIKRDRKNYFALFFITTNWLGLERAVESMWALDEYLGQGFHNTIDEKNDLLLFDDSCFKENFRKSVQEQIKTELRYFLQTQDKTNIDIYKHVLRNGYAISRVNSALKELQDANLINVSSCGIKDKIPKHAFYVQNKYVKDSQLPKVIISLVNKDQ